MKIYTKRKVNSLSKVKSDENTKRPGQTVPNCVVRKQEEKTTAHHECHHKALAGNLKIEN